MGLRKLAAKVADYQARLEAGKAKKIEAEHVQKVLDKLRRKEADLLARLAAGPDPAERAEYERKLAIARQHIERAEWLLGEIA